MRTRVLSSVGVVIVGLLPTIAGGPAFALLMIVVGILGYREYHALSVRLDARLVATTAGLSLVAGFGIAALAGWGAPGVVGLSAAAVALPMLLVLGRSAEPGVFAGWALVVAGTLYLGLPVFSAISLRETTGTVDAIWLSRLADVAAVAWGAAPRGLAWSLLVVLTVWVGDSAAYLVGRAWGRRQLAPRLSPQKTVEGAVGGLVCSALVGALAVWLFGLGFSPVAGLVLGTGLGIVGQFGDLGESMLKRQAGVKDSGAVIPGHGGILDRVDALLVAFPTGWLAALVVDRALQ